MLTKARNYGRPLQDQTAHGVLDEIEKYQGRVPYEMTPLSLHSLHSYIIYLEDSIETFRNRLTQLGAHHEVIQKPPFDAAKEI